MGDGIEQSPTVRRIVGPTILLASGNYFDMLDPEHSEFTIEDIAQGLSNCCRFAGQCREFYSVAQHSVIISKIVRPEHALAGLMHDAAEAYLPDLSGPIKKYFHVHGATHTESFDTAEDRLLAVIANALGFDPIDYEAVRHGDLTLLVTEARDLLGPPPEPWNMLQVPLEERITSWASAAAESAFLERYAELTE